MDYLRARFDDFSISRFVFIARNDRQNHTHRQTDRQTDRITEADQRYTHA